MSKTRRYNPETGEETSTLAAEHRRRGMTWEAVLDKSPESPLRRAVPDEACIARVSEHVQALVGRLVLDGVVTHEESQGYAWGIYADLAAAACAYDPCSAGAGGRCAKMSTFLCMVADRRAKNIRKAAARAGRRADMAHITGSREECAEYGDMVHEDDARLSDGCRSVRQLELRMDVATLMGMLRPQERTVVRMRLAGYAPEDIERTLGCNKWYISRSLMPRIRKVARLCGFEPRRGRVGKKTENSPSPFSEMR